MVGRAGELGTFWKGADRSVSTVPGCSSRQATFWRRRWNSTTIVLVNWFSAVLLARYEYLRTDYEHSRAKSDLSLL